MFVITSAKKFRKKRFKIYRYKKIIFSKKKKINFYSLTNLTIMMGAKAPWKNCREPVKYRAPSIMIFMQKQKRFPSSFF